MLHTPTLPIPGTEDYLVQLDVWHQLHCLNDLRKLLYPERYPGMAEMTTDGKIDRADIMFMHWGKFLARLLLLTTFLKKIRALCRRNKTVSYVPRRCGAHTISRQRSCKIRSVSSFSYNTYLQKFRKDPRMGQGPYRRVL